LLQNSLVVYNTLCFMTALLSSHDMTWLSSSLQTLCTTMAALATVTCLFYVAQSCPHSSHFGGSILRRSDSNLADENSGPTSSSLTYFETPGVPYLPALGIFVNWYLIAQLDVFGMLLLALYLGLTIAVYLLACAPYSVGHTRGWSSRSSSSSRYEAVVSHDEYHETDNEVDGGISMTTTRQNGGGVIS
jgi:hypothetical protein